MYGIVTLMGSSNYMFGDWFMEWISLSFTKLSHDEPWRLITHDGYIQTLDNDSTRSKRMLPPEIQVYIKSKFKTIEHRDYILTGQD